MKFSSYLDKNLIFNGIKGKTQEEVIENMLKEMSKKDSKIAKKQNEIREAVLKREREISTAIGKGIAIPHARMSKFNDFVVAIGILEEPLDVQVEGLNEKDEVKVVFLIVCDILKNKNILKIMSTITKLVMKYPEIMEKIKNSKNSEEIFDLIDSAKLEIGKKIIADDVLSPNIDPVTPDMTLEYVAKRLIVEKIAGIPVVDENRNFLGEITEKELIEFGMPKYYSVMSDLNFLTVGEPFEEYLINEKTALIENIYREKSSLCVIDRKAPIMEICFIMINKGITRIYVVEDGKYCGVIRRYDIIKKILHI
ncbi:MAG: PTS sugar transporter subunit IIA [Fusobacterium sp. JB021]|nr:PTS sugar transporter subunit IIA [Fusobacterium sp. JB021]MDP0507573.1 PTS sugar transporter subunit IIA [Fusobacterium sp. JB019]